MDSHPGWTSPVREGPTPFRTRSVRTTIAPRHRTARPRPVSVAHPEGLAMGNRNKLAKAFGDGAFGVPDVPIKIGHRLQAWVEDRDLFCGGREDKRSWK